MIKLSVSKKTDSTSIYVQKGCLPGWCPPSGECMPDEVCAPDYWCPPNEECQPDCSPSEPCPTERQTLYDKAFK